MADRFWGAGHSNKNILGVPHNLRSLRNNKLFLLPLASPSPRRDQSIHMGYAWESSYSRRTLSSNATNCSSVISAKAATPARTTSERDTLNPRGIRLSRSISSLIWSVNEKVTRLKTAALCAGVFDLSILSLELLFNSSNLRKLDVHFNHRNRGNIRSPSDLLPIDHRRTTYVVVFQCVQRSATVGHVLWLRAVMLPCRLEISWALGWGLSINGLLVKGDTQAAL